MSINLLKQLCYLPIIGLILALSTLSALSTELLPIKEAFQLNVRTEQKQIIFSWEIAEGYYLYKEKIKIATDSDIKIAKLIFPTATLRADEFFGKVGIYRNRLAVIAPIIDSKTEKLDFIVSYQGCADIGVCYPPFSEKKTLYLSKSNKPTKTKNIMATLGGPIFKNSVQSAKHPLPPQKAFNLSLSRNDAQSFLLNFLIKPQYYLYKDKLKVSHNNEEIKLNLPAGITKEDEFFGKVDIYKNRLDVIIPIKADTATSMLSVAYQGCWEGGVCYPPQIHSQVIQASLKNTTTGNISTAQNLEPLNILTEEQDVAQLFHQKNIIWILAAFVGFGLLLSLTPCVYPMLPILSGLLISKKQQPNMIEGLTISLVFVISMSLIYALVGVLAGYSGANLQIFFQTPLVLIAFSLVFVFLAFSMFGYYDIALPESWQRKLGQVGQSKSGLSGAALMGAFSALIVGPCVAPPLAGALIYISQSGDALLGGAALFFMGLGMGVPLLLLGASAGKLLPKAGMWMEKIKAIFGILMLGIAIYLLERILSETVSLFLWASLLTISMGAMGIFKPLPKEAKPITGIMKTLGWLIFGYGVLLFLVVAKGGGDKFSPLSAWNYRTEAPLAALAFQKINNQKELQQLLKQAAQNNQLAMLDFYADWCIECKEMERYLFKRAAVVTALNELLLIKADVTKNTKEHQALMREFAIIGPPALLFFKDSKELRERRIIGETDEVMLLERLAN